MKNDKITAELFREILINTFVGYDAIPGKDYTDWHTEDGKCGVTFMTNFGDYNIVITKKA